MPDYLSNSLIFSNLSIQMKANVYSILFQNSQFKIIVNQLYLCVYWLMHMKAMAACEPLYSFHNPFDHQYPQCDEHYDQMAS